MAEKKSSVDVGQLAQRELSETAFPVGKQDFRVFFEPAVHERIAAHAAEKLSLEICGFLVGQWHRDAGGPYLHVNEAVRCDKAASHAGDVTFTHEAWNEVNHEMDTKYPDRSIVGWYHSHPNFGIFLSDRDQFIQDYTFNSPGQIAYVVDPVNGVEGVFYWRHGKSALCPHFWVGEEVHLSSKGAARNPSSPGQPAGQAPAPAPAPAPAKPIASSLTWILGAICLLLLGYLLGTRDQAAVVEGVVRHFSQFKVLKLGMRETMDHVNEALQAVQQQTDKLAREHIALAGDAAEEKKKQWSEVVTVLQAIRDKVRAIRDDYSLDPQESAALQRKLDEDEAEMEGLRARAAKDSAARNSGEKATAAKPSAENPAKGSMAASPALMPDKPADSPKPATSGKKP
jgi:proteasome lid subunit RPN8/RPN11